jgi:regulator of RNase E activity RraA
MSSYQNPAVNFDVDEVCRRFSVIYTGAISDVLDEMGYRNQVLPPAIQGLTMDQKIAGVAMTVEGQPTDSVDPEVIYIDARRPEVRGCDRVAAPREPKRAFRGTLL